jgi:hypothetical protein
MNKRVYVLSGSEDGNLGVFSNKKAIWERALVYLGEEPSFYPYQKFLKEFDSFKIIESEDGSATIETFYLNLS